VGRRIEIHHPRAAPPVRQDPGMPPFDTPALHALVPFAATLGLRVADATPERARLELDHRPELCTAGNVLHGGAVMALADTAGAVCAFLNLPEGATTTTVESKTNLLAAVRDGTLTATATPLHVGGSLIVVETELHRADGRLAAKTTQTQAVLR
jgi:1,4-dihydroxy-2-naphthoyl-CoA hydrolase